MQLLEHVPTDPEGVIWDAVVVGTGAGGAAAGFNLARLGRSVLFVERGSLFDYDSATGEPTLIDDFLGKVTSNCGPYGPDGNPEEVNTRPVLSVGRGLGGTTTSFAMVMDRFRPVDLRPKLYAQAPMSTSLPEEWPIDYEDLEPYYREAELLFRVRGTDDPLAPTRCALLDPPPPSDTEHAVQQRLAECGLHPYRLHYAREYAPGCDGCVKKRCTRSCRNDAGRICVVPALRDHGAHILPNCLVTRLDTSGRKASQAICVWNDRRVVLRAKVFVLALNALLTPALLLRSANETFPDGLGNRSGMVGRNLMMHVSDLMSVRFEGLSGKLNGTFHHGLSLNDFYIKDGAKLGNIHAHAIDFSHLVSGFDSGTDSAGAVWFSTIVEDFPYPENRVMPTPGSPHGVYWEYRYPKDLLSRSRMLCEAFADALRPTCEVSLREPLGTLNSSHTCGTCRFGDDPRSSVLDRNNRIHDLDNVYVVDASFFPSSGGINPSLTIVANSLRASSVIAAQH